MNKTINYHNNNAGLFVTTTSDVVFSDVQDRFADYLLVDGSKKLCEVCKDGSVIDGFRV